MVFIGTKQLFHIYPNESNERIHPKLNKSWNKNNYSPFCTSMNLRKTDTVECTVLCSLNNTY